MRTNYPTSHGSPKHLHCIYWYCPTILGIPPHCIHLIVNVLYWTPPLTLPFITTERKRMRKTLCLVVNIALILEKVDIIVIDILEAPLIDGVIHSIPLHVLIMLFNVRICPSSVHTFPSHVLTIPTHVVIISS
jgi:hypothetical protein